MNKEKNQWREEMATLIEAMLEKNRPSGEFAHSTEKQPFFEDSCRFVKLHFELTGLVATLRNLNRYSEIISEESENEDNGKTSLHLH